MKYMIKKNKNVLVISRAVSKRLPELRVIQSIEPLPKILTLERRLH